MTKILKRLKDYYTYDPTTGNFIVKKYLKGGNKVGRIAGYTGANKYKFMGIYGKDYLQHRLVWLLHYGCWPNGEIDHIDHNPENNTLVNLRDVTRQTNHRNESKGKNNTSGMCGVTWDKWNKKWLARIMIDGKHIHLGGFNIYDEAVEARKQANIKYNFHPNHGEEL